MTPPKTIEFEIPVIAQSNQFGGKRLSTRGKRPHFFLDKGAQAYINELTLHCQSKRNGFCIPEGPIELEITFVIPRPARAMRKKDPEGLMRVDVRPDEDNYAKSAKDVLTKCGFWTDDGQVSDGIYRKRFHEKTGSPRIIIKITQLPYDPTDPTDAGETTDASA